MAWGRLPTHCDTANPCIPNPKLPAWCHRCAHPMPKPKPAGHKAKSVDGDSSDDGKK